MFLELGDLGRSEVLALRRESWIAHIWSDMGLATCNYLDVVRILCRRSDYFQLGLSAFACLFIGRNGFVQCRALYVF